MKKRIEFYTDQELDKSSNLYNYDARLYDPVVARFVNADSVVPSFSNESKYIYEPQMLNRFSYCRNNPLIYIDPDGLAPVDADGNINGYFDENGKWIYTSPLIFSNSDNGHINIFGPTDFIGFVPMTIFGAPLPIPIMSPQGMTGRMAAKGIVSKTPVILKNILTKPGFRKIDYLFKNKNAAMNFAKKQLGPSAERIYDESGKWIGWRNKAGHNVTFKHGDWYKGKGNSKFPHLNYDFGNTKGHYFIEDKIKRNNLWKDFWEKFRKWIKKD